MSDEIFDVSVPVEIDSGRTIWHKVGTYFKNSDPNKKQVGTVMLNSLPIGAKSPLKLFIYPRTQHNSRTQPRRNDRGIPPHQDDYDDVPY